MDPQNDLQQPIEINLLQNAPPADFPQNLEPMQRMQPIQVEISSNSLENNEFGLNEQVSTNMYIVEVDQEVNMAANHV